MAIGGKTLGIVSGMAVGATAGVILAALNPILPKNSTASVSPIEETTPVVLSEEETTKPALPKLSMVETDLLDQEEMPSASENTVQPLNEPEPVEAPAIASAEEVTPVEQPLSPEPPQTAAVDELARVDAPETTLATVLPEEGTSTNVEIAVEQPTAPQGDRQPTLSTDPAEAVQLAEPTLETDSPKVSQAEPVANTAIETVDVADPEPTVEPSVVTPTDTQVASLPDVTNPEAPKPVASVEAEEVVEQPTELVEEPKPNTSGTFKTTGGSIITQGSRLPTLGGEGDTQLASLNEKPKTSRFPTIGESSNVVASVEAGDETAETDLGALVKNAVEFPVTDDPLLSIVLIDDGKVAAQLEGLKGLNLPLTIAVSLDEADASDRAALYRAAGFEVLAMSPRNVKLSLSGGQSKDQVATLLDEYFDLMPQSIGLIDRPSANLQKDQRLARYIVAHFEQSGHGLVTYAGGLNSTKRIADQSDVANGTVFRFLDKSGEAGPIITQQLDRAAREARSKGSTIVMATASKATLGTLVSWSLSSKARAVTIAPVSASLLRN